jgi:uncharacterized phiE125 gp8 family phage protein
MGLSLVTPPAFDPITLAEAKAHLRVTSDDEDGLIVAYILSAREFVENETHLKLITQTLDYTVDDNWPCVRVRGDYKTRIEFPVKPVSSVSSVSYVDTSGVTQTLGTDQYVLRTDGAVHFVEPAYDATWPSVRCQTAAITIRFVAGYALSDVPNPLMQAMRMLIGHQYEIREAVNIGNIVTKIDIGVEAFLSAYRFTRFA